MTVNFHRFHQICKYGWIHASEISNDESNGRYHLKIKFFVDIIINYFRYGLWSNQYKNEKFWQLNDEQRKIIGKSYKNKNQLRENWVKDFYDNRKFYNKWGKFEIEKNALKREERNKAYIKQYKMGEGCIVEHGVFLSRQHHLFGELKVGKHVRLCKETFIDYTGGVDLGDYVTLCYGTTIETHDHDLEKWGKGTYITIPSKLIIGEGAFIGLGAKILNSCNYIGKYARIGAGAVVTKDIPDYALAVDIPAKVKRLVNQEDKY